MRSTLASQPQSPRPIPQPIKKKKENKTKARQMKAADIGLEDLMDWMGVIANEPVEEEEMSSLDAEFVTRICKHIAGSEGETTPVLMGNG